MWGLNFPYAVIIEMRVKKKKPTIIESSKAEQSTVNNWGFVLAFLQYHLGIKICLHKYVAFSAPNA